jgi:hypothetical protein
VRDPKRACVIGRSRMAFAAGGFVDLGRAVADRFALR